MDERSFKKTSLDKKSWYSQEMPIKKEYVKVLNCEQMANINKADKEKTLVSDGFFIIAVDPSKRINRFSF